MPAQLLLVNAVLLLAAALTTAYVTLKKTHLHGFKTKNALLTVFLAGFGANQALTYLKMIEQAQAAELAAATALLLLGANLCLTEWSE